MSSASVGAGYRPPATVLPPAVRDGQLSTTSYPVQSPQLVSLVLIKQLGLFVRLWDLPSESNRALTDVVAGWLGRGTRDSTVASSISGGRG